MYNEKIEKDVLGTCLKMSFKLIHNFGDDT